MKKVIVSIMLLMVLTVSVAAAGFKPSVSEKKAPELVPVSDEVAAKIVDQNGNVVKEIPKAKLVVSPLSDAKSAPNAEIGETLNKAYSELKDTASIKDICTGIDDVTAKTFPGKTAADLVVTDFFDVSLLDENNKSIDIGEGNYVDITFNVDVTSAPVVIHRTGENKWTAVDPSNVTYNANGTLTVRFDGLCPVAFLTANVIVSNPTVTSPQTGENMGSAVIALVVGVIGMGVTVAVRRRKTAA